MHRWRTELFRHQRQIDLPAYRSQVRLFEQKLAARLQRLQLSACGRANTYSAASPMVRRRAVTIGRGWVSFLARYVEGGICPR